MGGGAHFSSTSLQEIHIAYKWLPCQTPRWWQANLRQPFGFIILTPTPAPQNGSFPNHCEDVNCVTPAVELKSQTLPPGLLSLYYMSCTRLIVTPLPFSNTTLLSFSSFPDLSVVKFNNHSYPPSMISSTTRKTPSILSSRHLLSTFFLWDKARD